MRQTLSDLAFLLARVVVGVTFIAHGYQKFAINGMDATASGFESMGIPLPTAAAWFTALVELLGGAALVLGVLLPVAGVLLAAVMLGALFFAHLGTTYFVTDGGFEYVLLLAAVSLALGFGGQRYSVDAALHRRQPRQEPAGV